MDVADLAHTVEERATSAALREMAARLAAAPDRLVAFASDSGGDSASGSSLSIAVVSASGLSLRVFLRAVEEQLRYLEGCQVQSADLDMTLGPGQAPAAVLQYTQADSSFSVASSPGPTVGYQVAFYDKTMTHLIVMTFTTPVEHYREQLPLFQGIVRNVEFSF
jgi:hypothetical protein